MLKINKDKCTSETVGKLVKKRWDGDVWFITVEYIVSGESYICKEQLRYKIDKTYKCMSVPVGIHSKPAIDSMEIGHEMRVFYNPDKPKMSYLPDNEGINLM